MIEHIDLYTYGGWNDKRGKILVNWAGISAGFAAGVALGSFMEYGIHKYFLHSTPKHLRKIKYVKGMWHGHVVSHHSNYAPDDHYTRDDTNKNEVLTFSWYEGFLIVASATAVVYGIDASIRMMLGISVALLMPEVIGFGLAFAAYYAAYEWLHAVMHVPNKWRWICSTGIMKVINRHHYQHHLNPSTNLNVILPLADYVFGTKQQLPKEKYIYADAFSH
ncbi:sterol desaturase family protein [Candidatus Woesearchaeota archaeon]|nr:sterol desaturase family protein [Candidatus Woesearchaeota archaeon]